MILSMEISTPNSNGDEDGDKLVTGGRIEEMLGDNLEIGGVVEVEIGEGGGVELGGIASGSVGGGLMEGGVGETVDVVIFTIGDTTCG
jgi:hypothetical protein